MVLWSSLPLLLLLLLLATSDDDRAVEGAGSI
jgi:hypothetical protein